MAKITLHGMFARVRGKFNKSESLYFKGCPCKKEQLGVDLINPSLADPTERATLEAGFAAQSKYTSLFAYTVAQKYVKPNFN